LWWNKSRWRRKKMMVKYCRFVGVVVIVVVKMKEESVVIGF